MQSMQSSNAPRNDSFYSVSRFLTELTARPPSPVDVFRVGGRISIENGRLALTGQGQSIWLHSTLQNVKDGEHVVITFRFSDYQLDERFVEQVQVCEVLLPASGKAFEPNPAFQFSVAQKWAQFLAKIRAVFALRGLLEVTTPTLVCNPGMEPELEPFVTHWRNSVGGDQKIAYLCTSPELHMKQLLVKGFTDIYEVKTVFRNEEKTNFHEPEFQMLEWYRAYAGLDLIIEDLSQLVRACGLEEKIEKFTVAELFQKHTGHILQPTTTVTELQQWLKELGENPSLNSTWSDTFHHIWVAKIEPHLPKTPILVTNYPPELAALARVGESGWAERVEFFLGGVEIANAYLELNDPQEQRERFVRDQSRRKIYGRTELEIDENFMRALETGMPPSAGIALGLDRLFQVLNKQKELQNCRAFSVSWDFSNNTKD